MAYRTAHHPASAHMMRREIPCGLAVSLTKLRLDLIQLFYVRFEFGWLERWQKSLEGLLKWPALQSVWSHSRGFKVHRTAQVEMLSGRCGYAREDGDTTCSVVPSVPTASQGGRRKVAERVRVWRETKEVVVQRVIKPWHVHAGGRVHGARRVSRSIVSQPSPQALASSSH